MRRRLVNQRVFVACLRCILCVQCITPDPWLADKQAKDQQLHELYNQREHSNRRKMLLRDIALQEKKVKVLLAHARLSSGPNATVCYTTDAISSTPTSATLMPLQVEQNQRKEAYQRNQVRL